jgi:hypothetical protein
MKKKKLIIETINEICDKHNLSHEVKEDIIKLSKKSYVKGSNDMFNIFKLKNE